MKKNNVETIFTPIRLLLFFSSVVVVLFFFSPAPNLKGLKMPLSQPPSAMSTFKEIAVKYNSAIVDLFNNLSPEERIFVYYLNRASIPGIRIATNQHHKDSLEEIAIFQAIYNNREVLKQAHAPFLNDAEVFLAYLLTNYGQHFQREHANNKRTPEKLGLKNLTQASLVTVLNAINYPDAQNVVTRLAKNFFDATYQPTQTTPNDIKNSSMNIYSDDFTDADYEELPEEDKNKLNAYFYVDTTGGSRVPKSISYAATGHYGPELTVSAYWLEKALHHAQAYPKRFDAHLLNSLKSLIEYVTTGDEEFFKQHSIEWLKSSSKLDYCFGFIETYADPKGKRGSFTAEVTIKSFDIQKLNAMLPSIEKQLPLPQEFMRSALGSIPNASINTKIFGYGDLGPLAITAAYCLPNYEEIRSEYGSKQIIYPSSKSLEMQVNPEHARILFNLKQEAAWLEQNDPEDTIDNDIWDTQCILHETLGHGSGKLADHILPANDPRAGGGAVQTIPVTNKNIAEFLAGYEHTIEELRAEIIALYVSINHLDTLMECGLMSKWKSKLTHEELVRKLILGMARTGIRRYLQQNENATEISGDHARANCTIMYYLIEKGGLRLAEEKVTINGKEYTVVGLEIADLVVAQAGIKELMIEVQRIKSTGDGVAAKNLIEKYGKPLRHPHILKALQENKRAIVGDIKVTAYLVPIFKPRFEGDKIVDVDGLWPENLFEQYNEYAKLMLSTKI